MILSAMIANTILANSLEEEMGKLTVSDLTKELGYEINDKETHWGGKTKGSNLNKNEFTKDQAEKIALNAVRNNIIKKEPCHICRSTRNLQPTHKNLSKPFNVTWVCNRHN